MRRRALAVIALLAGCGDLTDGLPALGVCAESTPRWLPLDAGNRWVYDVTAHGTGEETVRKEWVVQGPPAPVFGLAGSQRGIRIWRGDDDERAGWRWFIDEDSAIWFRRDVWLAEPRSDPPCPQVGIDEDVRACGDVTPTEEDYYLPGRKRLDYRTDRVCEGSAWTERYFEWVIEIGGACDVDCWRAGVHSTPSISPVVDHWSVESVSRRIEVPAGVFEDCLCVRRREEGGLRDVTYCYARDVGKVYELDRGNQAECLAQYCIGTDCTPAEPPATAACRDDLLD